MRSDHKNRVYVHIFTKKVCLHGCLKRYFRFINYSLDDNYSSLGLHTAGRSPIDNQSMNKIQCPRIPVEMYGCQAGATT